MALCRSMYFMLTFCVTTKMSGPHYISKHVELSEKELISIDKQYILSVKTLWWAALGSGDGGFKKPAPPLILVCSQ